MQRQHIFAVFFHVDAAHDKAQTADLIVPVLIAGAGGHASHAGEHSITGSIHKVSGCNGLQTVHGHHHDVPDVLVLAHSIHQCGVIQQPAAVADIQFLKSIAELIRCKPDHCGNAVTGGDTVPVQGLLYPVQHIQMFHIGGHHGAHQRTGSRAAQKRPLFHQQDLLPVDGAADAGCGTGSTAAHHNSIIVAQKGQLPAQIFNAFHVAPPTIDDRYGQSRVRRSRKGHGCRSCPDGAGRC